MSATLVPRRRATQPVDLPEEGRANPNPSTHTLIIMDITRALAEVVGQEPRVDVTVVQTVGTKGYDGFLLALVRE